MGVRHFARTHGGRLAVPNDINFVPRPILGYFGSIDTRLDYELITMLAEADPDWSIVHGRPGHRDRSRGICRDARNIFWIGPARLPGNTRLRLRIPGGVWRPSPSMTPRACCVPLKINEYLMAGRPVVSTNLPEVRREFDALVSIAASAEEFIAACRRARRANRSRNDWARSENDGRARMEAHGRGDVERHVEDAIARQAGGG